jgi:hypothetical protein
MIACFAVCAAIRPKSIGVTDTSSSSPSCTPGFTFCAAVIEISSCLFCTFSTTISFA